MRCQSYFYSFFVTVTTSSYKVPVAFVMLTVLFICRLFLTALFLSIYKKCEKVIEWLLFAKGYA